jgi:hypothetical protein
VQRERVLLGPAHPRGGTGQRYSRFLAVGVPLGQFYGPMPGHCLGGRRLPPDAGAGEEEELLLTWPPAAQDALHQLRAAFRSDELTALLALLRHVAEAMALPARIRSQTRHPPAVAPKNGSRSMRTRNL